MSEVAIFIEQVFFYINVNGKENETGDLKHLTFRSSLYPYPDFYWLNNDRCSGKQYTQIQGLKQLFKKNSFQ